MEFLAIALIGLLMVVIGRWGLIVYARSFLNDPAATMSADVLLAIIKGPGAAPAAMCVMVILAGVFFIAISIVSTAMFSYVVLFDK